MLLSSLRVFYICILLTESHITQMEGRGEKRIIEKRVRMDKEPLENLLFRLFERQVCMQNLDIASHTPKCSKHYSFVCSWDGLVSLDEAVSVLSISIYF